MAFPFGPGPDAVFIRMSFRGAEGEPGTHLPARDFGKAKDGWPALRVMRGREPDHGFRVPLRGPGMTVGGIVSPNATPAAPVLARAC